MVYRTIGLMSGSSLDGVDLVFTELQEDRGEWRYQILNAACYEYEPDWKKRLVAATSLKALDYQLLHIEYGQYLGRLINRFMDENKLHYQVSLISSHGHTTFHLPHRRMTAQLGDGAAIAAETGLPVVSDLRALDVAFGGQGAPIVPVGEKLLLNGHDFFLNIGGIANISYQDRQGYIAFDICPANKVLNLICNKIGKEFDEGGELAARGKVDEALLRVLNDLPYYSLPYPKSLANDFGTDEVYPLVLSAKLKVEDELCTYVEHVANQIEQAIGQLLPAGKQSKMLVTGGGAFNRYLIAQLSSKLNRAGVEVIVPDENLVKYKEALIMALIGVLRWRQEYNVLSSVTGARRDSIGGAVWIGQEA
jgi:anhydro-N-acetylmuramic acid kinase